MVRENSEVVMKFTQTIYFGDFPVETPMNPPWISRRHGNDDTGGLCHPSLPSTISGVEYSSPAPSYLDGVRVTTT